MASSANQEGRARTGRFRGGVVLLPLVAWLLTAGCTSRDRPPVEYVPGPDPLRGGPPLQPVTGPKAPAPGTPTGTTGETATPKSHSPAALATESYQPLDPSRALQIGSPQPIPAGKGDGKDWKGPSGSGPVQPIIAPSPPPPPTARSAAPWNPPTFGSLGGRINSYEQAQSILASRRVTWQRLETWGDEGEWKFSCSIPNPQNPHIRRTYEARATEPIAALRAVVDQIDREQR